MRFELRKSGGAICPTCGSYDLIRIARSVAANPEDLVFSLCALIPDPGFWHPMKRRWVAQLQQSLGEAERKMLDDTRYPMVSDSPEMVVDRS